MRERVEITWVEAHITLCLDRKHPYCTGHNKIICDSLPRYNNPLDQSSVAKDL